MQPTRIRACCAQNGGYLQQLAVIELYAVPLGLLRLHI
jgi:hypothetical protein